MPGPPQERSDGPQRIAKLLARAGIASRREVERMIAEGRIALNGEKITTPATLLDDVAGLTVDGRPVRPAKATRLYRFYKPQRTLTAAHDPKGRPTLFATGHPYPGAAEIAVGCLTKPYSERQLTKAIECVDRHLQGEKVKAPKGLELFIAVSEEE